MLGPLVDLGDAASRGVSPGGFAVGRKAWIYYLSISRRPAAAGLDSAYRTTYICGITPRRRQLYSFWINPEQRDALRRLKDERGVPESEQIRRAIDAWLKSEGVTKKAERKRAVTRKRS